jgi:hypothetical protein
MPSAPLHTIHIESIDSIATYSPVGIGTISDANITGIHESAEIKFAIVASIVLTAKTIDQ